MCVCMSTNSSQSSNQCIAKHGIGIRRITGLMDHWAYGSLGLWITGLMDHWAYGSLGLWITGLMDHWAYGSLGLWITGLIEG